MSSNPDPSRGERSTSTLCLPTLAVAATNSIKSTEQGLASGLQGMSGQAGGGLFLALTAAVITVETATAQGMARVSVPDVSAQLSGLHAGLLVLAASVALGVLIALTGIRSKPLTRGDGSQEERR